LGSWEVSQLVASVLDSMVYQAPLVVGGILAAQAWRALTHHLEAKSVDKSRPFPMYFDYYVFFYIYMLYLSVTALMDYEKNILSKTNWLDPATVADFVNKSFVHEQNFSHVYEEWKTEHDLSQFPNLKRFAFTTPIWLILTWIVCVWHTWTHVQKITKKKRQTAV